MKLSGTLSAALLVCLGAALWGTVGAASKLLYSIEPVPPAVVGFFRLAFAVPILFLWCCWRLGWETLRFPGRDALFIAALGLAMAAYQICYFQAVADIGVALATLIAICAAPILVGLAAPLLLKERLNRRGLAGLVIGVAGAALLLGVPAARGSAFGALWAAAAALAYTAFVLCSRRLAHHDPGKIIVVGFSLGALPLLPFALFAGIDYGGWPPAAWATLLYIGLLPTALAYIAYFRGMRGTAATPASVLALCEPLTATAIALVAFGERLPWTGFAGAGLLLLAMVLVARGSRTHEGAAA